MFAKKINIIIILLLMSIESNNNTYTKEHTKIEYDNDFEKNHILYNGVFDNIKPSGDMVLEWGVFVFKQGGGRSMCMSDINSAYLPPSPHSDGNFYHTVNDITWRTFRGLAKIYGYCDTPSCFYDMTEEVRKIIITHFMTKAAITESDVINGFLGYVMWGSGSIGRFVRDFEEDYGDIHYYLAVNGEYKTLHTMITSRRDNLKRSKTWDIFGRGWSSALAHYHRIFKHYCQN